MYMLHRKDIDEYKLAHIEDVEIFNDIINNNLFDKEDSDGNITRYPNKLELITDKNEIKKVLSSKFSSRNRTEEYTAGLPSATVISSGLFPMNIDPKSHNSKFNILRWWNNTSIEDMNAQKVKNKLSTDSGTFIHAVLENAMNDNARMYIKKKSLDKYIQITCESPEIIKMIENFEDRKFYFIEMAQKTLKKFFENDIEHITPVASELFINLPGKIQGAVDLLCYYKKRLTLLDYKTSKGSKSRNQLIDSGYVRQLYIYSRMLYLGGYISKKELEQDFQGVIAFFNWNSNNSFIHEFTKEEIDKCKAYVNFVYSFYWKTITGQEDAIFEL